MNYTAIYAVLASLVLLVAGGIAGAQIFPQEIVETKYKEVEVPVQIERIVEVPVEDTARIESLQSELLQLRQRYEQEAGREYDADRIARELELISQAQSDIETDYKHMVLQGFTPSQVSFIEWHSQSVNIESVERVVKGVEREYDLVEVEATTRVRYSDEDSTSYLDWVITIEYDLNSQGHVQRGVSVTLA